MNNDKNANTNENNSVDNTSNNNNSQEKVLRVIAKMFRQHADLFLKQATYLEQMSIYINKEGDENGSIDDNRKDCINKENVDSEHGHGNGNGGGVIYALPEISNIIPCREDIKDKIRREAVVDLAKKSFENTKELKSIVDQLMKKNMKYIISTSRKLPFELFQEDAMEDICKEKEFKELLKKDDNIEDKNNGINDEAASYMYRRTQEEWKKLNKKKVLQYAKRADGDEGVRHIHIPRRVPGRKRKLKPSTEKKKEDGNSKKATKIKCKEEYQEIRQSSNHEDSNGSSSDSDHDEKRKLDMGSDKKKEDRNRKKSVETSHNDQSNSDTDKSGSDSDDDGFDFLKMPPIPKSQTNRPLKRERDESSSSDDKE